MCCGNIAAKNRIDERDDLVHGTVNVQGKAGQIEGGKPGAMLLQAKPSLISSKVNPQRFVESVS